MISTLHSAADEIRSGRRAPIDVLEACLERIDHLEDRIRAWVFVDRDGARADARRLSATPGRGPLHGVPLGVKDIFDVTGWPTAAGSRLWKNNIAQQDAAVVRRLREAGAVFIGKTVTTQYASFDPPPTRNPWNAGRTPGGSSSGSAAALACGMCLGALGSQTGGSITRPASYCGVAGLKPTFGRVSAAGVVPLAASMDHVGVMGRCVRDLAILYHAITDPERDNYEKSPRLPPRLGRLRGLFESGADAAVIRMMDETCDRLKKQGATILEAILPPSFVDVTARHRTVMAVEAAAYHEARLRSFPQDYDPNIRALIEEGLACPAPAYARCKTLQTRLREEMSACFADLDVLLTPAATGPAPDAATTGDPLFNSPWSFTGLPTVCFPGGRSPDGLPLGLQLVGAPWSEESLLKTATWCEEALGFEAAEPVF